ncbi:MAG: hypothetical protein K2Q06_07915 [Parvularculaceae bacterium]|nr:hypothetical protein [Parvularculaceae bacterium]
MTKSLKREQARLLRLEKQLLAAGAVLAGMNSSANAHSILGETAKTQNAIVTDAYLNLVQAVQAAHDVFNAKAIALGVDLMQASGTPKDPPVQVAKSILGLQ